LAFYPSVTIGDDHSRRFVCVNSLNLFKHTMMRLQFAQVRSFGCRGRLRN